MLALQVKLLTGLSGLRTFGKLWAESGAKCQHVEKIKNNFLSGPRERTFTETDCIKSAPAHEGLKV